MDDVVYTPPFWWVWNPDGYSIGRFPSQTEAKEAACDAAMNHVGLRFYVLMPTTEYVRDVISVRRFTNTEENNK